MNDSEKEECITEETEKQEETENKEETFTEEESIPDFTDEFVQDMINKMLLDEILPSPRVAREIFNKTYDIFSALPNIIEIDNIKNITIVGDTHGQFHDVAAIFKEHGYPTNDNPYIFNGDFVDRGNQGIEIILTLFALKIANPDSIYLNRGNQYVFL